MDPISAIGVAAAIVQFTQASLHVLKICGEIRNSAESSTQHNRDLEEATRAALQFRKDVGSANLSPPGSVVTQIARKCEDDANELIDVLERVRSAKGKQANKAKAIYRAFTADRKIEQIEGRLRDHEQQLDHFLTQTMQTDVKAIRKQLDQMDASSRKDMATLTKSLSDLQVDVKMSEANVRADIGKVDRLAQTRHDEEQKAAQYQRLLDSLFFPDIDHRRQGIKEALPETTNWIFGMQSDDNQPQWANFETWLREDSSVYWISGKAASGKSTLMAKIVDDKQTQQALKFWSQDKKLCIFSFYFWRPGSELQRSIVGILRSLLHQIYRTLPEVAEIASHHGLAITTWTEKKLSEAIKSAFDFARDVRACLFIDGLDEYDGNHDELLDLIFDLDQLENVKFCVSSRPETDLRARLKNCKGLRLEDYNRAPIHAFVSSRLSNIEIPRRTSRRETDSEFKDRLIDDVVDGANGIFLWAVIVSQALIRGVRSGDDEQMLFQRLHETPKELETLFAQMMGQVENVHKSKLAFYFQVMRLTRHSRYHGYLTNLCLLTAAWNGREIDNYESFTSDCMRTKEQILAQSAGLLEVRSINDELMEFCLNLDSWDTSPSKFLAPALLPLSGGEKCDRERMRVEHTTPFPSLLAYEREAPEWIHRSVYDYVFPSDKGPSPPIMAHTDDNDVMTRLYRGAVDYFAVAPSCEHEGHETLWERQVRLSRLIELEERKGGKAMTEFLDRMASVVGKVDPDELHGCYLRQLCNSFKILSFTPDLALVDFWSQDHLQADDRYSQCISKIISQNAGLELLIVCLLHALHKYQYSVTVFSSIGALVKAIKLELDDWQASQITPHSERKFYADLGAIAGVSLIQQDVSRSPVRYSTSLDEEAEARVFVGLAHALRLLYQSSRYVIQEDDEFRKRGSIGSRMASWNAAHDDLVAILVGFEVMISLGRHPLAVAKRRHSNQRLTIEVSPHLWMSLFARDERAWRSAAHGTTAMTCPLRFICRSTGRRDCKLFNNGDLIVHVPQVRTIEKMLRTHDIHRVLDDNVWIYWCMRAMRKEMDEIQDMVIQEIWENGQGLSATEQLYLLACIRTEWEDFFFILEEH